MRYIYCLPFIMFLFIGCASRPSPELNSISYGDYKEVDFNTLPSWQEERFEQVLDIFLKTCQRSAVLDLYKASCRRAEQVPKNDHANAKAFFESNFTPFVSLSKSSLATGYYEPFLQGSLEKTDTFFYPVYGVPEDLLHIQPIDAAGHLLRGRMVDGRIQAYFTRAQIAADALGTQKPICYVDDAIALFFLHVQGSGCVRLEDGSVLYLGYADSNGHPYKSIGKEMVSKGLIDQDKISLKSIVEYFNAYPGERDRVLGLNPSYIFFAPRKHSASGALGVVLEAERSIAVDRDNIPLGMPLFISTADPLGSGKYEKIVFAHDTGSAIKGESRIDLFFGSGKEAGERAGKMMNPVQIWMLVPNDYLSKQAVK